MGFVMAFFWALAFIAGLGSAIIFGIVYYRILKRPTIRAIWLQAFAFSPVPLIAVGSALAGSINGCNVTTSGTLWAERLYYEFFSAFVFTVTFSSVMALFEGFGSAWKRPSVLLVAVVLLLAGKECCLRDRSVRHDVGGLPAK